MERKCRIQTTKIAGDVALSRGPRTTPNVLNLARAPRATALSESTIKPGLTIARYARLQRARCARSDQGRGRVNARRGLSAFVCVGGADNFGKIEIRNRSRRWAIFSRWRGRNRTLTDRRLGEIFGLGSVSMRSHPRGVGSVVNASDRGEVGSADSPPPPCIMRQSSRIRPPVVGPLTATSSTTSTAFSNSSLVSSAVRITSNSDRS